ncbi:MAG: bifunctional UDP-N-acetylglucosamine diphosphorylase/glucosamine-1-phosphate N-acetyltransferase GlmU [Clostridia bacterium]|nr:bifunctional UDP-N-acetylglucosamine diphosphorylase/glucosamine-1-phosphate N-acetyltransferase GlmU [Clostridia bacterium]
MNSNCAVILAAGEGTRMKSSKPKVMAEVLFKPMINWVIDAAKNGGVDDICVVTGYRADLLEAHLDGKYNTVLQSERLGTGHAVMQAREFLLKHKNGNVLILNGDAPLMDSDTIHNALDHHIELKNSATVITANLANPFGYGRIVRNEKRLLKAIVEEKEATDEEKEITEVNSGAYWFKCEDLLKALDKIVEQHEEGKEYYLTDAIEIIIDSHRHASAFKAKSSDVVLGANDRAQLYELNEIARKAVLYDKMRSGVSIPCIDGVIICPDSEIGIDTEILPGTIIKSDSTIGKGCVIGPNSIVENSVIEDGVELNNTQVYSSTVKAGAHIGPFVRIRPDCVVGEKVKIGNFVELKNTTVGDETSIAHLTYLGDADFGKNVNIGCGCATVNYNGKEKNRTVVGDHAFIGCSTYLVAPVTVGDNAYTAAGSVITEDVPEDALALARSRQVIKKDWVKSKKPYKWQK